MKSVTYTIPYSTQIKFNDTITLPTDITEIVIEATTEYIATPYISAIKFNSTQMKYNDGNTDYTVYSSGKWATNNAKTIVTVSEYIIETQEEKAWWLDNTDLTEDKLGNGEMLVPPEEKSEIEVVNSFLKKYDYLTVDEAEDIYYQAKNTYLDLAFPFNYDIVDIPVDRPRAIYWIKDCMKEIIDRNGITATSYSENGLSYHWSTDMVSDILRGRIVPQAVVRGSRR